MTNQTRKMIPGESFELSELDPVLKTIRIDITWQLKPELKTPPEADIFALLLDKDDIAPTNEDFIFFNQVEGVDNAAYLKNEDNTANDHGGSQSVVIDLDALRYDIVTIKSGLNIYRGNERDQTMRFVDHVTLTLYNHDDDKAPLASLKIKGDDHKDTVCMVMLALTRSASGSGWSIAPLTKDIHNFAELARNHGIVVAG